MNYYPFGWCDLLFRQIDLSIKKAIIMILRKNSVEKLQKNQLLDLAKFVVTENFKHHSNGYLSGDYRNDVDAIYKEEVTFYENSEVFTVRDYSGFITGSIRLLKWNYTDVLPIQKIFGINPFLAINSPQVNDIYHVGRFAVRKDACDLHLFKRLLICVAKIICSHKGNIAFAECDSKLLRVLKLLGVKAVTIGKSIDYLGSETIPIAMTYDGVIDFYKKNERLTKEIMENDESPLSYPKV